MAILSIAHRDNLGFMRLLIVNLGGILLGLYKVPHYQNFANGVDRKVGLYFALSLVIIAISWLLSLVTADPLLIFWSLGSHTLLGGLAMTVFVGGVIAELLKNIAVLLVIRMGWDPMRTWLDDILVMLATLSILLYFDNRPDTIIAVTVMVCLTPWTLIKLDFLLRNHLQNSMVSKTDLISSQ